jgi:hypothetical protein
MNRMCLPQTEGTWTRMRKPKEEWSEYLFGVQKLPHSYLLWKQALLQLAPRGRRPTSLGPYIHHSHEIWDWVYNLEDKLLLK